MLTESMRVRNKEQKDTKRVWKRLKQNKEATNRKVWRVSSEINTVPV